VELRLIAGGIVTVAGAVFLMLGALGIVRMPDLYNRMQAGTKATTLGNLLALGGMAILRPDWLPKIALIALFVLMTNPISSHALARAAHRCGMPLASRSVKDDLVEHSAGAEADGCRTLSDAPRSSGRSGLDRAADGESRE
jgi:multicomponent Na+:H+ antiporter subunit G